MDKKVPFVDEVEIFNSTFGKPNNYEPTVPADTKLTNFVVDFIKEETEELAEAIENGDIVEVLDAICDLLYVAVGNAAMVFGVKDKLIDAYAEVQASNMSKSCATLEEAEETVKLRSEQQGEPCHWELLTPKFNGGEKRYVVYRTRDNKVMKSINYFAPNLEQFFTKEEIQKAYDDRTGKN